MQEASKVASLLARNTQSQPRPCARDIPRLTALAKPTLSFKTIRSSPGTTVASTSMSDSESSWAMQINGLGLTELAIRLSIACIVEPSDFQTTTTAATLREDEASVIPAGLRLRDYRRRARASALTSR